MRKYASIWVALLGILVGALAVMTVQSYYKSKNILRVQGTDWRKLNLILQQIDRNYVDTIDREKVTEAAIAAALAQLDPHSVYMPPVKLTEAETELAGNFDGIGIQFNVPNDTAIVLEVIPGGPSEKAGLLQGDRILQVDDKVIAGVGFPQDSMVRRESDGHGRTRRGTDPLRDYTRKDPGALHRRFLHGQRHPGIHPPFEVHAHHGIRELHCRGEPAEPGHDPPDP